MSGAVGAGGCTWLDPARAGTDLVNGEFTAQRLDQPWVSEITPHCPAGRIEIGESVSEAVSAQRSLRMLGRSSDSTVRVRRGHGPSVTIRVKRLGVGDVVQLRAGQSAPADCRLLECHDLEVDESSLTGESVAVLKSARSASAWALAECRSMEYEGSTIAVC